MASSRSKGPYYTRAQFKSGPWHLVDESKRSKTMRGPVTICGCEIDYFWETVTEEEAAAPRSFDSNEAALLANQNKDRQRSGPTHDGLARNAASWPTPTEDNANNQGGPSRREGMESGKGFQDLTVAMANWPTPTTRDQKDGNDPSAKAPTNCKLGRAAPRWPTPTSAVDSGSWNLEGSKAHEGVSLTDAVVYGHSRQPRTIKSDGPTSSSIGPSSPQQPTIWPTPRNNMHKEASLDAAHGRIRKTGYHANLGEAIALHDEREGQRRRLNPRFVEWLMGWPLGWTNLRSDLIDYEHWETESSLLLRRLLSGYCGVGSSYD